jgi:outer membrane beta-barrel protein
MRWPLKKVLLVLLISVLFFNSTQTSAQSGGRNHELAPFIGMYAPDRFETSLSFGVRYHYRIDSRFGVGATFGIASAKQDYVEKVTRFRPDLGGDGVMYYTARMTQTFYNGATEPYMVIGLGLTRQHDESNFTFSLGGGTRVRLSSKLALRYELIDNIFSSGTNETSYTANNLEIIVGVGFFL